MNRFANLDNVLRVQFFHVYQSKSVYSEFRIVQSPLAEPLAKSGFYFRSTQLSNLRAQSFVAKYKKQQYRNSQDE